MSEWYLGDNWDEESQKIFEQKLKKSRGDYNKAQYLRIKGSSLLKSKEAQRKIAGCDLLNRVVKEYPSEISHVMFALEQLGDYYYFQGEYDKAELNYRQSISFYKEHGRSGTSGIGDIKLAETVVKMRQTGKFTEMYNLLINEFTNNDGALTLNDDMYRYYSILAKISIALDKKKEAKEYAQRAIQLVAIKEPQLNNYPQLGLVRADSDELAVLKNIIKAN